jgi:hypothetical protein
MTLTRSNSLKQAQSILDLLDKDTRLNNLAKSEDLYVRPFVNGREQGYGILINNPTTEETIQISFAENRSSDDVVVYMGEPSWLNIHDETVSNPKYFKYARYEEATEYIITLIKEHLN